MEGVTAMRTREKTQVHPEFVEQFRQYLKSGGLRLTSERLAILEQVFSYDGHFQAEDLLVRIREKGHSASRATIYRTLPLLVKSGLLTEIIDARKNSYYEHVDALQEQQHAHLICLRCNEIIEFTNPEIDKLQKAMCDLHQFEAVKYRNEILGYCKECQTAGR